MKRLTRYSQNDPNNHACTDGSGMIEIVQLDNCMECS